MSELLPEWLTQSFFYGEDSDGDEGDSGDEGDESEEDEDSDEGSDDEGEEGDDEGDEDEEDESGQEDAYEGLRTALTKERKLHRQEKRGRIKAERELASAQAQLAAGTNKESEAINDLQTQLDNERGRTSSLAKRFATTALHTAIKEAAGQVGFIDPEDALSIARNVEVEQDDDDPTQVEVDNALILAEVKALAKKKPHLVSEKKTQEKKVVSGRSARRTNVTRRTTKSSKSAKEKELLERYPSLK